MVLWRVSSTWSDVWKTGGKIEAWRYVFCDIGKLFHCCIISLNTSYNICHIIRIVTCFLYAGRIGWGTLIELHVTFTGSKLVDGMRQMARYVLKLYDYSRIEPRISKMTMYNNSMQQQRDNLIKLNTTIEEKFQTMHLDYCLDVWV